MELIDILIQELKSRCSRWGMRVKLGVIDGENTFPNGALEGKGDLECLTFFPLPYFTQFLPHFVSLFHLSPLPVLYFSYLVHC